MKGTVEREAVVQ